MAGTIIFPPSKPVVVAPPVRGPIPITHCEVCAAVFGKAGCLQHQYNHVYTLVAHDENGEQVYVCAGYFEGATLYSFAVLATLDSTMFAQPQRTAQIAVRHLQGLALDGSPF